MVFKMTILSQLFLGQYITQQKVVIVTGLLGLFQELVAQPNWAIDGEGPGLD